jgi:ribose transport system permease protein
MAWSILVLDIVLVLIFGALTGGLFLKPESLEALAVSSAEVILLATGSAAVLCLGEIDISLGAVLITASVASGLVLSSLPPIPAVVVLSTGALVAAVVAVVCTAASAFCVLVLRVNSFIATLAMLGILTGVVYVVTDGNNLTGLPAAIQDDFGGVLVGGLVPAPAVIAIVGAAIMWFVLRKTRFGVHVIACGSSRSAAQRAGVDVPRTILITFLCVGVLCGVAGFIDISRFGTTDVTGHQTDALAAIAGAVIGGARLSGGRVSILGAVAGALLASILQIGLVVAGLQAFYQLIVIGLILIASVAVSQRQQKAPNRG